mgnify:CR=1 FL=1
MPGVVRRVLYDKHLGVIVGDSRLVSIAAVKRERLSKFESKASLITRLAIVPDPQVLCLHPPWVLASHHEPLTHA